ncbi:RNA polymerase III subunit C53 [Pichia californica]|uniref:RNA polymerase III subunit C53 n=1 Tax=Pichia californica TaxID=460514 RepID=A0A9P6WRG9_9ASCO|nr:RNA polymerase III subunit C53 [[Candida] californica]
MSKRLDSISRPTVPTGTPTTAKPSLKFKPKAVSRKTKEERENANKINTPGINKIVEKNNNKKFLKKGPQQAGGIKGNKKLNGTQIVISGPLSEGTISLGGSSTTSSSSNVNGKGSSNPLLERLKLKAKSKDNLLNSKIKKEHTGDNFNSNYDSNSDDDDDDDDNAIDMSKKSILDDDYDDDVDMDLHKMDADLFPVRAERNEHREYGEEAKIDKTIKTEFHNEKSIVPSETPSREPTVGLSFDATTTTTATTAKSSSSSHTVINGDDANLNMNNYQEQTENKQLQEDYNILSKNLKNLSIDNNMFFMQLPCSLPILEGELDGEIGKIRIHKSGKMTMKIGKVKFEILRGGSSDFRQDVMLVNKENNESYHIGNIKEKITAIPKIL